MRHFILIFTILFTPPTFAGLSLSQAIVHFEESGRKSEDVDVFNQGPDILYVRIEPSVILNPGKANESRKIYRDPKEAGLLVTPQRMVLAPGSRKRLRFVRLDNPDKATQDKVFRVLVKPEIGEVKSSQTAVKIIVAYEVLVLSQPKKPQPQLVSSFKGRWMTVTNRGNTNVLLQKGHQCPVGESIKNEPNQCVELAGKRLYAGNSWQVEVPFLTPVNYRISVGLNHSIINFERKN
ncbi:fimbrial biogenesis chaperone [Aliikangiella sp. IMCC44359]|uniref:fimbrial biogenesis chaperone n=1 Tax=Aliikangiella sp. IMCC44359 TaxID=3459125 RepID=UPI00403AB2DD